VSGIGVGTFYSGFRLHMGGPFPTSRQLEARSAGKAANASATAAVSGPALVNGELERVTKVGGSASLLAVRAGSDAATSDFASVAAAYGEASDVTPE